MGKASTFTSADARPRVHLRLSADRNAIEYAGHPSGPWKRTDNIIEAIDQLGGDGAYRKPAVLIWDGEASNG